MTNEFAIAVLTKLVYASDSPDCIEAVAMAQAALRSPAPGAAAMREAAARVAHREGLKWQRLSSESAPIADACRTIEKQIRALPLPAPEVPEEFNWNKAKPFQSADEWYSGKPSNDETHARTAATVQWLIEHGGRFPNEPAPEVPEVIKTWCKNYDATEDCGGLDWARNSRLRDYYRKEHGI